tara:strand:+ start:1316 stop:1486 length:171 start_codon:yes stop_codon:yes gene_type:complete
MFYVVSVKNEETKLFEVVERFGLARPEESNPIVRAESLAARLESQGFTTLIKFSNK